MTGYTSIWNALDYATAVFPVTMVDPIIDAQIPPRDFLGEADKWLYDICTLFSPLYIRALIDGAAIVLDDPETFKGAPVAVQLVGRTLEEEAVIAMTEVVDLAIKVYIGSEGTILMPK